MSQVFNIRTEVQNAALAEQACRDQPLRVQDIKQRVRVLGQARCEDDEFESARAVLQEVVHAGPFSNVDFVEHAVQIDGQHEVGIGNGLGGATPRAAVAAAKVGRREQTESVPIANHREQNVRATVVALADVSACVTNCPAP